MYSSAKCRILDFKIPHNCIITLLLNVNHVFYLPCLEKAILFFSSIHVILKIDFKNKMQDQAAIGLNQFWILIEFDIKFWTYMQAKNIFSPFGPTKWSYASFRDSVSTPCSTLWAASKNAISLDIAWRPYLIPHSSMCDWSTPRVWLLFLSMTFTSSPTKPICRCEHF